MSNSCDPRIRRVVASASEAASGVEDEVEVFTSSAVEYSDVDVAVDVDVILAVRRKDAGVGMVKAKAKA